MHKDSNNSLFQAWSEADRRARDAERALYEMILTGRGHPPAREDVEQVRILREQASALMNEMLEGIRAEAQSLKQHPGEGHAPPPSLTS